MTSVGEGGVATSNEELALVMAASELEEVVAEPKRGVPEMDAGSGGLKPKANAGLDGAETDSAGAPRVGEAQDKKRSEKPRSVGLCMVGRRRGCRAGVELVWVGGLLVVVREEDTSLEDSLSIAKTQRLPP